MVDILKDDDDDELDKLVNKHLKTTPPNVEAVPALSVNELDAVFEKHKQPTVDAIETSATALDAIVIKHSTEQPSAIPVPGEIIPEEELSRTPVAIAKRIAARAENVFSRTIDLTEFGFTEDTKGKFASLVGPEVQPLLRAFNNAVLENPVRAFDFMNATFQGALGAVAQILEEVGVSRTGSNQFIREMNGGVAMLMGRGPLAFGTPLPKLKKQLEPAVERVTKDLSKKDKAVAKEKLAEALTPLEQMDALIAEPGYKAVVADTVLTVRQRALQRVFATLHPLKVIGDRVGNLVPWEENRLNAGLSDVINAALRGGAITWDRHQNIRLVGKSLEEIQRPVLVNRKLFSEYAVARRAPDLRKQGIPTITKEMEVAGLNLGKQYPEFVKAFNEYQTYNQHTRKFLRDSGVFSDKQLADITKTNPNYMPLNRIDQQFRGSPTRKISARAEEVQNVQIRDVIENQTLNQAVAIETALLNRGKMLSMDLFDQAGLVGKKGSGAPVERLGASVEMVKIIDRDLKNGMKELGIDTEKQLYQALSFKHQFGKNVTGFMRAGKWEFYKVNDPALLDTVNAFSPKGLSTAVRLLGAFPKLFLTRMVTAELGFQGKNAIRSTVMSNIQSESGKLLLNPIRGLKNRLLETDLYWDYLANGGGMVTMFASEVETARGLQSFAQKYNIHNKRFFDVLDTPNKTMRALDKFLSASEMMNRLAEFESIRATTRKTGEPRASRKGAFAGRNVDSDFGQMGSDPTVRFFVSTAPFLNPNLQGLFRLSEVVTEHPMRTIVKGVALITMPSLMLHRKYKDEKWYRELPDWIKDNYWPLKVDPNSEQIQLIPKPFQPGAIFGTIPVEMTKAWEEKYGTRFINRFLDILADQLGISPTPQLLKIYLEQKSNEKFSGSPIVPTQWLGKISREEQFKPWTSETMVEMAAGLKEYTGIAWSPMRAEALVRQISGELGMYLLEAGDASIRAMTGKTIPTPRLDETPIIKTFLRTLPLKNTQAEIDFYELLHAAREVAGTYAKIAKYQQLSGAERPEYDSAHAQGLAEIRQTLETYSKALAVQNKRMLELLLSDKTADEMAVERNEIYKERNRLFHDVMKNVPEKIMREERLQLIKGGSGTDVLATPQKRGFRNNNPLNLKELPGDKTQWEGERKTDDDKTFEEFKTPYAGIRAGARILFNYKKLHGIKTVMGAIHRFAPASENPALDKYTKFVAKRLGVDPKAVIDLENPATLKQMVKAIIHFENGSQPYSDKVITQAIKAALK